jgi:hypothetical protein
MNPGEATVDWLYRESLRVDDAWSVRTRNGFTWWPGQNAQHVEVIGSDTAPNGDTAWYLRVRTEVLREVRLTDSVVAHINDYMMGWPSLSGPVYDTETSLLSLCAAVPIHGGNRGWMQSLLSLAAQLQIEEAQRFGARAVEEIGASPALSGHPHNGARPNAKELAETISSLAAAGERACSWSLPELKSAAHMYIESPPVLKDEVDASGWHILFPCGERQSECSFLVEEKHPRYGNGLAIIHTFELNEALQDKVQRLALHLNSGALSEAPYGCGLGSYSYYEGLLHFTTFLPNAVYRPNMLPSLYFACGVRARAMASILAGDDWMEATDEVREQRANAAVKRLLRDIEVKRARGARPPAPPSRSDGQSRRPSRAKKPIPAKQTTFERLEESEPVPLDRVGANGLTALIAVGIVNPFGPTLALVAADGPFESGQTLPIVELILNPFSQTCCLIGQVTLGEDWTPLESLEPFMALELQGCPTLLLPNSTFELDAAIEFHARLLARFDDGKALLSKVKRYPKDPWKRISSDIEATAPPGNASARGKAAMPEDHLDPREARELSILLLDPEARLAEFQAFAYAWNGAIKFQADQGNDLPSMPWTEFVRLLSLTAGTCALPAKE